MSTLAKIFETLNEAEVKYLLIGGLASGIHGVPRTTVDIDIAILPSIDNLKRTFKALQGIGLIPEIDHLDEVLGCGGTTFLGEWEVDVLTDLPGTSFDQLWSSKVIVEYEGVHITVISKKDLVQLLKKVGRQKDLDDADYLER